MGGESGFKVNYTGSGSNTQRWLAGFVVGSEENEEIDLWFRYASITQSCAEHSYGDAGDVTAASSRGRVRQSRSRFGCGGSNRRAFQPEGNNTPRDGASKLMRSMIPARLPPRIAQSGFTPPHGRIAPAFERPLPACGRRSSAITSLQIVPPAGARLIDLARVQNRSSAGAADRDWELTESRVNPPFRTGHVAPQHALRLLPLTEVSNYIHRAVQANLRADEVWVPMGSACFRGARWLNGVLPGSANPLAQSRL
jgi:hypothetical protein